MVADDYILKMLQEIDEFTNYSMIYKWEWKRTLRFCQFKEISASKGTIYITNMVKNLDFKSYKLEANSNI